MHTTVNNPGQGNCAFYAYSIALIDIIKQDFRKKNKSDLFETWTRFYPEISLSDILSFDNKKQNKALLDKLQSSLRSIVFAKYQSNLQIATEIAKAKLATSGKITDEVRTPIISDQIFVHFAMIVRQFLSNKPSDYADYNPLTKFPNVMEKAKALAQRLLRLEPWLANTDGNVADGALEESYLDTQIFNEFAKDVYGENYSENGFASFSPNSILMKALKNETERNFRWGTYEELAILSETFGVDLQYRLNGEAPKRTAIKDRDDQSPVLPQVIVNNHGNTHWTTTLEITSQEQEDAAFQKYSTYTNGSLLTKEEIRSIFHSYTHGLQSFFGRNHKKMAETIIMACDDPKETVDTIVNTINSYVKSHKFNSDSHFKERANFIAARYDYSESLTQPEADTTLSATTN